MYLFYPNYEWHILADFHFFIMYLLMSGIFLQIYIYFYTFVTKSDTLANTSKEFANLDFLYYEVKMCYIICRFIFKF